ncbi:MAG: hypothetical protein WBL79_05630, partial [Bacillota bacterium]
VRVTASFAGDLYPLDPAATSSLWQAATPFCSQLHRVEKVNTGESIFWADCNRARSILKRCQ